MWSQGLNTMDDLVNGDVNFWNVTIQVKDRKRSLVTKWTHRGWIELVLLRLFELLTLEKNR